MIEVVASVLSNNPSEARGLVTRCEGTLERISVDIIDGKFADNQTIEPELLSNIDTNLKVDFHLMVIEPINWIEKCAKSGADRIIGHIEKMDNQTEFVKRVQNQGVGVGLAVDLGTPLERLDYQLLSALDVVLVMSVKTGFGGQKFDDSALRVVRKLNRAREEKKCMFRIHIDGGVTLKNVGKIALAGADEVSVGRRLFDGDVSENVRKYQKAAEKPVKG